MSTLNMLMTISDAPLTPLCERITGSTHVFTEDRLCRMYITFAPVAEDVSQVEIPRSCATNTSNILTHSSSEKGISGALTRNISTMQQHASKRTSLSEFPMMR